MSNTMYTISSQEHASISRGKLIHQTEVAIHAQLTQSADDYVHVSLYIHAQRVQALSSQAGQGNVIT